MNCMIYREELSKRSLLRSSCLLVRANQGKGNVKTAKTTRHVHTFPHSYRSFIVIKSYKSMLNTVATDSVISFMYRFTFLWAWISLVDFRLGTIIKREQSEFSTYILSIQVLPSARHFSLNLIRFPDGKRRKRKRAESVYLGDYNTPSVYLDTSKTLESRAESHDSFA